MPTFRYDKLTATSHSVRDAHTGEVYGIVRHMNDNTYSTLQGAIYTHGHLTRDAAAHALYAARYARGFEAGAL